MKKNKLGRKRQEKLDWCFEQAVARHKAGLIGEAVVFYGKVVEIDPLHEDALYNLGVAYLSVGSFNEAVDAFRKALKANCNNPKIYCNLGAALINAKQNEEAVDVLRKALQLAPAYPLAHNNLGNALSSLGNHEQAVEHYEQAIRLDRGYIEPYNNLATTLVKLGRAPQAVEYLQYFLARFPNSSFANNNMGLALLGLGDVAGAIAFFRKALAQDQNYAEAHVNFSQALFLLQDFENAWERYKWRERFEVGWRPPCPAWQGEPLEGKSIVVLPEAGIGDELMFFPLAARLAQHGANCTIVCNDRLQPLFARSMQDVTVVGKSMANGLPFERFDYHCRCLDIGRILGGGHPFPIQPRLVADEGMTGELRRRYADASKPIVGVSWASKHINAGCEMTIPLIDWKNLLTSSDFTFVNLQYGDSFPEADAVNERLGIRIVNDPEIDPLRDMDGFASQVAAMDLVVTIDNSTATMAASLGKAVWNIVNKVPMWQWPLFGERTAWYENMRLLRFSGAGSPDAFFGCVRKRMIQSFDLGLLTHKKCG